MSRLVALGPASQDIYLIDRDDFVGMELDGQSVFGAMSIGSRVDIDKAIFSAGGSGANAAVSFARHGHETILMSTLAHDVAGNAIIECLDDENIDSSYIEFADGATACTVVLLDAITARSTVLSFKGVSARTDLLRADDLDTIQPDWLYATSLGGDIKKLFKFFTKAHALDAKVMWAPGPAELAQPEAVLAALAEVDVIIMNKDEAASLVPGKVLPELLAHLSNYCGTAIITDGIMGAIATNHQDTFRVGVYEPANMRDGLGAGDAFASGFLAEYADSGDFEQALRFAAANATKVTQAFGAETGILTSDTELHPLPITKIDNPTTWLKEEKGEL